MWIWTDESSGLFSVKSFLLKTATFKSPYYSADWEYLWKLRIQDRLKLLLWKVASGALKTRAALGRVLHAKQEEQFLCPICRQRPEDTLHLLVTCRFADAVWRESSWAISLSRLPLHSPAELISTILNEDSVLGLDRKLLRAFILNAALVFDVIWHSRNLVVHEDTRPDVGGMIERLRRCFSKHSSAWLEADRSQLAGWQPPPSGWLKVNTDVAIWSSGSYIAISIKDSLSSLCMAYTERLVAMHPPFGEAFALEEAVHLVSSRGWSRVVFESDSLVLCWDVLSPVPSPLLGYSIVGGVHSWMLEGLDGLEDSLGSSSL